MDISHWPDKATLRVDQFLDLCGQLSEAVRAGDLELLEASHPLDDVQPGGKWAADIMSWTVRHLATGNTYSLFADTYHGRCEWRREDR